MQNIIQTTKLTKYYGKQRGVVDLDLEINKGEIFGFLGPNGAGKTTTMRLLLHLLQPTSGKATVLGENIIGNYPKYLSKIGYLPGDLVLYKKMTGNELLKFSRQFYSASSDYTEEIIKRLECQMDKQFGKLSKGNKQKIGILLALFHQPELLLLDEPTSGLDPISQNTFYEIIRELNQKGTTVLFSSHNLPEVEKVCQRIGIIKDGRLVKVETLEELRRKYVKIVEVDFDGPFDLFEVEKITGVKIQHHTENSLRLEVNSEHISTVLSVLSKYSIRDINLYNPTLEKLFLTYYK